MKIERINENQIRCTLTSFDLSVRNLNLGELAYGSEKARNLFREMIQKASNEVGFEAEDIPLMVEAIPLSNESVMLVITKIEDPEELDTRFSKFAPSSDEDDGEGFLASLANELLEGADSLLEPPSDVLKNESKSAEKASAGEKGRNSMSSVRVYGFNSLDQVSDAASVVGSMFQGVSTLYKKPETREYFLVMHDTSGDVQEFSRICNILAEYGSKLRSDAASEAFIREHYEVISRDRALQVLANI